MVPIRVKAHTNWCNDLTLMNHLNRCCPNNDYSWKDIQLTIKNDYDFFAIFNYPRHPFFNPRKAIVLQSETKTTREYISKRAYTLFGFNPGKSFFSVYDIPNHHAVDKWFHSMTYAEIAKTDFSSSKSKLMSGIVSGNNTLDGHKLRLDMVRALNTIDGYEHFGRGDFSFMKNYKGPIGNKEDGLIPYQYHFNCENDFEPGYFTEKFLDALFFESLIFYDGCTNIDKFFNQDCYIKIDVHNPLESMEVINRSILDNEWAKRLTAIKDAKDKALNVYNPMEVIWKIIHEKV